MNEVIQGICNILHDYHKYNGFNISEDWVESWANQFEPQDRQFILEEFLHLLNKGIYVSEADARASLVKAIKELAVRYRFDRLRDFLANAEFVQLQPSDKSQGFILKLLDDTLNEQFGMRLSSCGTQSKKYIIYLDDVLATGNTVYNDALKWLQTGSNAAQIIAKERFFIVSSFCIHTLGQGNVDWRLKLKFGDKILDKLVYRYDFLIENQYTRPGQKLNFAYPDTNQPQLVHDYLTDLPNKVSYPMQKGEHALRDPDRPKVETFYSSKDSRKKFEDILLIKGIEILGKVEKLSANHRPLGVINPSYQRLGMGTLFFTWRNISNTTPVVFWWNNHGWQPLFELVNRGGSSASEDFANV
jgi:hypothetical protein